MQKNENFAKQAEQAEAERPEVVGVRYEDGTILSAEDCGTALEVCAKVQTPLMTVAQHERIVGELRFERQQMDRAFTACINERDAANARLHEVATACATAEQERDAALVRVAELEKQEPVALANRGIHAFWVKWTEAAAGLYGPGIKLYAHPVAQAQHSVPEGWRIERSAERIVVMNLNNGAGYAAARDGESGIAESVLYLLAADLLAAAPGTEVPQAWLDVQAERKRQVEVEGWTPEHDDAHSHGQMARAAACYALAGSSAPNDGTAALLVSLAWPWDEQWWKPSTARRDMVKACALGLAEIERLDRVAASQGGPSDA